MGYRLLYNIYYGLFAFRGNVGAVESGLPRPRLRARESKRLSVIT